MKFLFHLKYYLKNFFLVMNIILLFNIKKKKKIGVIGLGHGFNIGNNLLKYAIFIKLSELGFIPYIIGTNYYNRKISFLKKNTNCVIIKNNFSEIQKNDYDILMVNSDQTWRKFDKYFYDIGFLKFAKNWNLPKFVYGASIGYNNWILTKKEKKLIKDLLKNFTGISVREKNSVKLVKKYFGIKPEVVLDPTLLINKKYYLNIIKNLKININITNDFIFTYLFRNESNTRKFINKAKRILKYKIYNVKMNENHSIEKFIYGIVNSKAVITSSFHGTIFSIIFNKPFICFMFKGSPKGRLISLKETLKLSNRIFEYNENPNISLLTTPLDINHTLINLLKNRSIDYLKKNLNI